MFVSAADWLTWRMPAKLVRVLPGGPSDGADGCHPSAAGTRWYKACQAASGCCGESGRRSSTRASWLLSMITWFASVTKMRAPSVSMRRRLSVLESCFTNTTPTGAPSCSTRLEKYTPGSWLRRPVRNCIAEPRAMASTKYWREPRLSGNGARALPALNRVATTLPTRSSSTTAGRSWSSPTCFTMRCASTRPASTRPAPDAASAAPSTGRCDRSSGTAASWRRVMASASRAPFRRTPAVTRARSRC